MAVARAWRDREFEQQLLDDPKGALAEEGLELDDDVEVKVVQDTPEVKYVTLSRGAENADPDEIVTMFNVMLPIAEGHEIRLVQSTEHLRYVLLPLRPEGIDPDKLSEPELTALLTDFHFVGVLATEALVVATTEGIAMETTIAGTAEAVST